MFALKKWTNIFFYNIFKFECFTQYLIAYPIYRFFDVIGLGKLISKRIGIEKWDDYLIAVLNSPKEGISIHLAGIHVSVLLFLILFTAWNLLCGFFRINNQTIFKAGLFALVIPTLILSHYAAPLEARDYIHDFEKYENLSASAKFGNAIFTILVEVLILTGFVLSFIYLLRSTV